jgi:nitrite reductase/ring-hydroxylating ferredoxin subunit
MKGTRMADFVEVARLEQVPPGTGNCFTVGGKELALFNVDGAIYAIEDSCLHKGASLATGQLEGKVVTCRAHGWRYDVTTGSTMNVPGYGVSSYPAKIVDGKILVAVT